MTPTRKTTVGLLLVLSALVLAVSACGGDEDEAAVAEDTTEQTTETGNDDEEAIVDETVTFELEEVDGSGVTGSVELVAESEDATQVTVRLEGAEAGPHPAHIHRGSCDNLDPEPYEPLEPVEDGESQTTIEKPILEFLDGEFAVNVHESPENADVYIACGDVPDMDDVDVEAG